MDVVVVAILCGLAAVLYGIVTTKSVTSASPGNEKMQEIAGAIQEGAGAYLGRQYRTIAIVGVVVAALVGYFLGITSAIGFVLGAVLSGLTGFIGMNISVRANVRTAEAARGGLQQGLTMAFRAGAVTGLLVAGLALLAIAGFFYYLVTIAGNAADSRLVIDALVALAFGASLISIFARLGGGIFTKAADVGADLVGKVEAGIPEDDPRNPATIADNVGDNVGDCAGMAADLFESYEVTLVASIILGVSAFNSIGANPALGLVFPLIARAIGVLSSIVGVFAGRARETDASGLPAIRRGFLTAGVLTLIGTLAVAVTYIGNANFSEGWRVFGAVAVGLVLAQIASAITEYFTSTEKEPVREIAESATTGPATTVLSGISSGLESSVWAIVAIAGALGVAIALGGGNL
ncbi:MAG: sodium/proton-translocating pyrophosphatase, partial [Sphingomonadaceae bacterium]|nr:sodium/proton-translocating pyrophosphatase [Sphingomonadaceae bacterium]